jgi:diguanylate cyclase (GGDEF)-like protein
LARRVRTIQQDAIRGQPDEQGSLNLATRLAGLWRVLNEHGIGDAERVQQLLDFSTASLRPELPFVGLLTHLEDGTAVIDAVSLYLPAERGMETAAKLLRPGEPFPFEATIHRRLFAGGRAQSWDNLAGPDSDLPLSGPLVWSSMIGTTFHLGAKTTFLIFGSPDTTQAQPFSSNDLVFIDVLASIVEHRLQQELMRERLRFQIEHDALTGLRNRTQFRLALRQAITMKRPCALALVDLDDFSAVNKVSGHMIADELLVEVGTELDAIDEFDVVARDSADHFTILMHDVETEAAVASHVEAYLNRFSRPFKTGDRDGTRLLSIGTSIGVSLYPSDGADVDGLMRRSLFAVEVAKSRGGGQAVFFRQEMEDEFQGNRMARSELFGAIEGDQLLLAYQPTFDLTTGKLTGAEALVRWQHPVKGLLLPGAFVPFAEREDELIGALGRWIMERAVRDLATLEHVPDAFCCYINMSPRQLHSGAFMESLQTQLKRFPHVAAYLGIEISETGAMHHAAHSIAALNEMRDLGVRIALDDFGTGYSSLTHLKRLPLDVVKIDRSFVAGLPSDQHDQVLCEAMISLADRFGFATLAEGIENQQQAEWLRAHGCRFGQGYDLGRPASWEDLQARLESELAR